MRCRACNEILDRQEEDRKYAGSGQLLELCDTCLTPVRDDIDIDSDTSYLGDEFDYDSDESDY